MSRWFFCLMIAAVVLPEHTLSAEDTFPLLVAPFDEVEAKQAQREIAEQLEIDVVETNSIGMKLTLIPAGEFLMGGDQSAAEVARISEIEASFYEDEHPQHTVRITQPFLLGTYAVTQSEWEAVMGTNPSMFSPSGRLSDLVVGLNTSRFPVEIVSWYDAVEFCNKLSQQEGLSPYYRISGIERSEGRITEARVSITGGGGYRLPTEAEWEYSCRAGTTTPFHFGTSGNAEEANLDGEYPYGTSEKGPYLGRTTTVGSYAANGFGLYDMHGNVWEWCADLYDAAAYSGRSGVMSDPVVTSADEDHRVLRGGSWYVDAGLTRSAIRSGDAPGDRDYSIGFRLARTP